MLSAVFYYLPVVQSIWRAALVEIQGSISNFTAPLPSPPLFPRFLRSLHSPIEVEQLLAGYARLQ